ALAAPATGSPGDAGRDRGGRRDHHGGGHPRDPPGGPGGRAPRRDRPPGGRHSPPPRGGRPRPRHPPDKNRNRGPPRGQPACGTSLASRRSQLTLVALLLAALVGVFFIGWSGSPAHKKLRQGLDLQGGLEVVLQAQPPRGHVLTTDDMTRSVDIMRNRIDRL